MTEDLIKQVNRDYAWDSARSLKPLFIPLKSEYYEAFNSGEKSIEYRKYGKGWNKETCKLGRPVVISKGYGKQNRRTGVITGFGKITLREAPQTVSDIYPDAKEIAAIGIKLDSEVIR